MKLFLLRHAAAENSHPDSARPLSETGFEQVKSLAARTNPSDFSNLAQIWHSTYERAEQTARKFSAAMGFAVPMFASGGLTPMDNPKKSAQAIASVSGMGGDLLVVGHNPHLEDLAALLVTGSLNSPIVHFRNCALLRLELVDTPDSGNEYGSWIITEFLS